MVLARSSEAEQAPLESRVRGNKRVVIMPAYVCVCVCVCTSTWVLSAPWGRCRAPHLLTALAQTIGAFEEELQPWLLQLLSVSHWRGKPALAHAGLAFTFPLILSPSS